MLGLTAGPTALTMLRLDALYLGFALMLVLLDAVIFEKPPTRGVLPISMPIFHITLVVLNDWV